MIRKQTFDGQEVTLTNEGLKEGDKVFPISFGSTATKKYVHREFDFRDFMSGWPRDPHTIQSFYMDGSVRYIRTDKGYSPEECYFKIEKKQVGYPVSTTQPLKTAGLAQSKTCGL